MLDKILCCINWAFFNAEEMAALLKREGTRKEQMIHKIKGRR